MSATQRFYIGFFLALAAVIALSLAVGYQIGESHARQESRAVRPAP